MYRYGDGTIFHICSGVARVMASEPIAINKNTLCVVWRSQILILTKPARRRWPETACWHYHSTNRLYQRF